MKYLNKLTFLIISGLLIFVGGNKYLLALSYTRSTSLSTSPNKNDAKLDLFKQRSFLVRKKIASLNIESLNQWWKERNIEDPHKFLLPVILARLSLQDTSYAQDESTERLWKIMLELDEYKPVPYHFRSYLDIRIFFLFRDKMHTQLLNSYKDQLRLPKVLAWADTGTENHMFMQRSSGLALMDGTNWLIEDPATKATIEAWLLSERNKFLTIGQGEFHSSTYYGYSIGGLLNLYDFSREPELKFLAKNLLDYYATNMALRLSWGTAGGVESRGYDRETWNSGLTTVAWMWWGDGIKASEKMSISKIRLALAPSLSTYRPPRYLSSLALKQMKLPFSFKASHPHYYSYFKGKKFLETFYLTDHYSLGTLLTSGRQYQVKGTINAQYATYKLVVRNEDNNDVISLGGIYHGPQATGRSPGDQYVQEKGAVIYQLILNDKDLKMGVSPQSNLVLPKYYGEPIKYKSWYIWRLKNIWLCARPWGDRIEVKSPVSKKYHNSQFIAAHGNRIAWITDIAKVVDFPDFESLKNVLEDEDRIDDSQWGSLGSLSYKSFLGDEITMTYNMDKSIPNGIINGKQIDIDSWPVFYSSSDRINAILFFQHLRKETGFLR